MTETDAEGGEQGTHAAAEGDVPARNPELGKEVLEGEDDEAAACEEISAEGRPSPYRERSPSKLPFKDGMSAVFDDLCSTKASMERLLEERQKQVEELQSELERVRAETRAEMAAAEEREKACKQTIEMLEKRLSEVEGDRAELHRSLDKKGKMHESTLELMHDMQTGHNETSKAQLARITKLEDEMDPLRAEAMEAAALKAQNAELTEALEYLETLEADTRTGAERMREEMARDDTEKALQECAMLEVMLRKERAKNKLSDETFRSLQARTAELGAMDRVFRVQESLLEEIEVHVSEAGLRLMREAGRQLRIYNRSRFDQEGRPLANWVGPTETDNPLRPPPPPSKPSAHPASPLMQPQSPRANKRARKEEEEDPFEHPQVYLDPTLWTALSGGDPPPPPPTSQKKLRPKRMIEPKFTIQPATPTKPPSPARTTSSANHATAAVSLERARPAVPAAASTAAPRTPYVHTDRALRAQTASHIPARTPTSSILERARRLIEKDKLTSRGAPVDPSLLQQQGAKPSRLTGSGQSPARSPSLGMRGDGKGVLWKGATSVAASPRGTAAKGPSLPGGRSA